MNDFRTEDNFTFKRGAEESEVNNAIIMVMEQSLSHFRDSAEKLEKDIKVKLIIETQYS